METRFGTWRLFIDAQTCEVLGSTLVGPRADDIIHVISTMMHFRGTVHDIAAMPWYHPTLTEVLINLQRDAAAQLSACEPMPPAPA
jgi:dihydrolipoamide dehydrogenase